MAAEFLEEFPGAETFNRIAPQLIDLNGPVSPAVLAGLLDCSVALVYQYRQNGRLPPNSDASYKECIKHHLTFWKNRTAAKANNLTEAVMLAELRLKEPKIEREWLAVKKERAELLEVNKLAEVLEPVFLAVRTQLCSLARKHPEVREGVDKILEGWERMGKETFALASQENDDFIKNMMEKDLDVAELKKKEQELEKEDE